MTELSSMLNDLYAGDGPTRAPSWSSEAALDEAFASWVPGPAEDASATERSIVANAVNDCTPAAMSADDGWLRETAPMPEPPVAAAPTRWSPSDDDILPPRRRGRRG